MRIVIAGAGQVGSHLAKLLSNEAQDILIIDADVSRLQDLDSKYNLLTLEGNPTSFQVLRDADVAHCDLFICVMPSEANNVLACAMAKALGAKRTVARIENYGFMEKPNLEMIKNFGVDNLIYPEYLAAQQIITALKRPWVRQWFEILNGEIIVVAVRIRSNAALCGMQLKDFTYNHHNFHVSAIKRGKETLIPRGNDRMEAEDILYFTTRKENVESLIELTGKKVAKVKKVLVMGASKIAVRMAEMDKGEFKFTVIDKNRERCDQLPMRSQKFESIYCGDARDAEVLADIGIDKFDAFIALSDSSEVNILTCLTAKEAGVQKTIAEVEDIQFINQADGLNIGTVINKKLLASSGIFQLMLDSDSSTSKCLALTDAEVIELEVKPNSKITRAAFKYLNLSNDMTLAGLIRDGHGMLVTGNTQICAGDHVVVFCLAGAIHKVEKLFT